MSGKEESAKHVQNTSVFAMVLCLLSLVLKIISAIMGKTALQITDAARCLAETTVVVIWWYICSVKKMDIGNEWQNRFNRTVRYAMIWSSAQIPVQLIRKKS